MIEQQDVRRVRLAIVAHIVLATGLMGIIAIRFPQFPFGLAQAWVMVVLAPAAGAWIGMRACAGLREDRWDRHVARAAFGKAFGYHAPPVARAAWAVDRRDRGIFRADGADQQTLTFEHRFLGRIQESAERTASTEDRAPRASRGWCARGGWSVHGRATALVRSR